MDEQAPETVRVPADLAPLFRAAERVVSRYFAQRVDRPDEGTIEIFGERYVLVRAASLSVEFFELVREIFGEERTAEADEFARNILFDLAHSIGKSDALNFHGKMGLADPIAKLSAGPVHFAYTGWASVHIRPESRPVSGSEYYIVYDHPYSFESEAWIKSGKSPTQVACIMSAGYSSGWCEESFGMELVATEVLCRARGDECCRFVMAPPARIQERLRDYAADHTTGRIEVHSIPDFFSRKRLEEELLDSRKSLERRVEERTRELSEANEHLEREIREREAIEARLRQTEKLEAIGQLTGGIAHDFNNLLTVMLGYTNLALSAVEDGSEAQELIAEARKAAERAAALTQQLMAFGRQQVLKPRVLDLNEVVVGMAQMLPRVIGEHIELDLVLDPARPCFRADVNQIEQVLLNLAVNSRDAMPQGGRLQIETRLAPPQAAEVSGRAMLYVRDTGVGMDPATQERVFEPFFTTKGRTKGTGLGLATVHGIVAQSRGEIRVESEVQRGTTFTITFPAVDERPELEPSDEPVPDLPAGARTILLVEDEAAVRGLIGDLLAKEGYRVLRAADAESALDLAAAHAGTIDLMLTDVVMPRMSGKQLAEELRITRPETRVLFMSGYADKILESAGEEVDFLQKPCGRAQLARKVSEILSRGT